MAIPHPAEENTILCRLQQLSASQIWKGCKNAYHNKSYCSRYIQDNIRCVQVKTEVLTCWYFFFLCVGYLCTRPKAPVQDSQNGRNIRYLFEMSDLRGFTEWKKHKMTKQISNMIYNQFDAIQY
jgi:hypothetical protein